MTLRDLAQVVGTSPKRVINTLNALGVRPRYSEALARRLAAALAIHDHTGVPLRRAFALAARALKAHRAGGGRVSLGDDEAEAAVVVDVDRILSSHSVRLSALRTTLASRRRGRPPTRRANPLKAAAEWGIDLSLLRSNLTLTPESRLRQLDAMAAFARDVRRAAQSR